MSGEGFTRDGHLSDLGLDRTLLGELGGSAAEHAGSCGLCAERLRAAQSFDDSVAVMPRARVRRTGARWFAAGTTFVAAAAALLLVTSGGSTDNPGGELTGDTSDLQAKGPPFAVELYRHDGERSRRLRSGEAVRSGDRVGFRVRAREDGYLLIVGQDARGELYTCYPQRTHGAAAPLRASRRARTLQEAVRFDDVAGSESIYSVFCPEPFELSELAPSLPGEPPRLPVGCVREVHVLQKD